uniref:Putative nucleotidyltransferase n=1 Tax=Eubacterium cellulosolvens (strain ATCC 43171 / JCM 9499 / 6) TaxID=633697 RepID=I5AUX9_EUBC6
MKIVAYIEDGYLHRSLTDEIVTRIREVTKADAMLVISEGNFLPEGTPVSVPHDVRAEEQVKNGADLVLELPVTSSLSGSGGRNEGIVALIRKLDCVDEIAIIYNPVDEEKEEETQRLMWKCAEAIADDEKEYRARIIEALKEESYFLDAQVNALVACVPEAKKILNRSENVMSIRIMSAMVHLEDLPKITFLNVKSIIDRVVHETLLTILDENFLAEHMHQGYLRKYDRNAADILQTMMKRKSESEMRDYMLTIAGKTEFAAEVILAHKSDIEAIHSFEEIVKKMERWLYGYLDKVAHKKAREDNTKVQEEMEKLEAQGMSRMAMRLYLLHVILNVKTEDMIHFSRNAFCPYVNVIDQSETGETIRLQLEKNSQIHFVNHEQLHTRGLENDETEYYLDIDRRAEILAF